MYTENIYTDELKFKACVERVMREQPWCVQYGLVGDNVQGWGTVTTGGPSTLYREYWANHVLGLDRREGVFYKAGELIKQLFKGRIKF